MKDYIGNGVMLAEVLRDSGRDPVELLSFAIDQLIKDPTHNSTDMVTAGLAFEELLETLINARAKLRQQAQSLEDLGDLVLEISTGSGGSVEQ